MTITWARPGSAGAWSVISLGLVKQPGEVRPGHCLSSRLVALHGPGPEIEVERAGAGLDGSPQRPPVLGGQAEQPGPGDLVAQRPAVVLADQIGQPVEIQAAFAPDVAELEAGVIVARVFVVDEPDAVTVVDEVPRQQV